MEAREKRLAEIKERLERATPGPWRLSYCGGRGFEITCDTLKVVVQRGPTPDGDHGHLGAFIAHSPEDIKYLLEELERLSGSLSGQWVSCSERLPEPYKTVLCRGGSYDAGTHGGYLLAAYYPRETDELAKGDWYYGKQMNEAYDVTHWMPLPKPPLANKEAIDKARGVE